MAGLLGGCVWSVVVARVPCWGTSWGRPPSPPLRVVSALWKLRNRQRTPKAHVTFAVHPGAIPGADHIPVADLSSVHLFRWPTRQCPLLLDRVLPSVAAPRNQSPADSPAVGLGAARRDPDWGVASRAGYCARVVAAQLLGRGLRRRPVSAKLGAAWGAGLARAGSAGRAAAVPCRSSWRCRCPATRPASKGRRRYCASDGK
ncbi:PREDICTED: uncharacterized protein LOC106146622, partial [Chinchilla lanigera]|uniref:uncharacterized protein LOC106146622 n=1 Tax=Chinchilla lanigera TaxID=34839 RepID=UPI0006964FB9